jgi:hypothetical protein
MKVFISWSEARSKAVAETLSWWLKQLINEVDPWTSSGNIEKGKRWGLELAQGLEDTNFGIICLTLENLTKPWILFEAGALSKLLNDAYVCTYLIGLKYADVTGPLEAFQHTLATREDTHQLVKTINAAIREEQRRLSDDHLDRAFDHWWPDLEKCLNSLPVPQEPQAPQRKDTDMLREVLEIVRDLAKSPPVPAARTIGEFFRGPSNMGSFYDTFLPYHTPKLRDLLIEARGDEAVQHRILDNFLRGYTEGRAQVLQAVEVAPKLETPNTSKPVTSQKKAGSRRRS